MLTYKTSHIDVDENDSEIVIDLWNEMTITIKPRDAYFVVQKGRGAFSPPIVTGIVHEEDRGDGERTLCEAFDWFTVGRSD